MKSGREQEKDSKQHGHEIAAEFPSLYPPSLESLHLKFNWVILPGETIVDVATEEGGSLVRLATVIIVEGSAPTINMGFRLEFDNWETAFVTGWALAQAALIAQTVTSPLKRHNEIPGQWRTT